MSNGAIGQSWQDKVSEGVVKFGGSTGIPLLSTAGDILSVIGQNRAYQANEDALEEQAHALLVQSAMEAARQRRANKSVIAGQRAQVAASGVRIEGSQGDLLYENAVALELGVIAKERYARMQAQFLIEQARDVDSAQSLGLVSGFLGTATNLISSAAGGAGY